MAGYKDIDEELAAERANGDRLHAALSIALAMMNRDDRESLMHTVMGPISSQLTVGHVLDGAMALHERVADRRIYA